MRTLRSISGWAVLVLALSPLTPSAAQAGPAAAILTEMAAIEATAPLDHPSEEAVKAAITVAVQKAARGAIAMGLPWLHVQSAYVRAGYVGVQVLALAKPSSDGPDARPQVPDSTPPDSGAAPEADDPPSPRIRL
jgi:hypothetical protein